MRWTLLVLLAVGAPPLVAQGVDPVRLRLAVEEAPRVGRAAPPLRLPYATREGPGPADQPFDLAKELGRIVVIAFYPGDFTPGCTAEWRAFRDRATALFDADVVVAGVSADSLASHTRFARELDLPFKLLTDPDRRVARRWGASDGRSTRRVVVVVGRDGTVRYVDPAFAALDPASYAALDAAIDAARKEK